MLKYFSIIKLYNAFKVLISFYLSTMFKRPVQWGKPIGISIEPTTSCNLRCPECPSGLRNFTRPIGMLNKALFQKAIVEIKHTTTYLTFYFQGEPYLNPQFLEMVKIADEHKIYTSTSTNAHYLTKANALDTIKSGLKRIIISIDGTTQDVYEKYRVGGDLNKVLEGTKNLIEAKRELGSSFPKVVFQFLVFKPNQHQIQDLRKLASLIGVDEVKLKTAQIYDFENGNELIPSLDQYARYKKNDSGKYQIKSKLLNKCWKLWNSCVITWDGKVLPCCFDKDAKFEMGNIQFESFKQIWQNDKYVAFRKSLLKSRKEISICKNCSEGLKVWED